MALEIVAFGRLAEVAPAELAPIFDKAFVDHELPELFGLADTLEQRVPI